MPKATDKATDKAAKAADKAAKPAETDEPGTDVAATGGSDQPIHYGAPGVPPINPPAP